MWPNPSTDRSCQTLANKKQRRVAQQKLFATVRLKESPWVTFGPSRRQFKLLLLPN